MASLSRSQLLVYGAVAVTLLLVGARWIRSSDRSGTAAGGVGYPSTQGSASSASGSPDDSFSLEGEGGDVVVDVTGAVANPGVYRMPAGSRVNDAVQRAGGATGKANVEGINLAARLSDGQQIVVPEKVAGSSPAADAAAGTAALSRRGPRADQNRRRSPRGRGARARARPSDRAADLGQRHPARAGAVGGGLPDAKRYPPGPDGRSPPAHGGEAGRGHGANRRRPRPRRGSARERDPGAGGRAPAGLRARRGRPHRPGHSRGLQAVRTRAPTRGLGPERDPARPA